MRENSLEDQAANKKDRRHGIHDWLSYSSGGKDEQAA